jgi:hypothetical protein
VARVVRILQISVKYPEDCHKYLVVARVNWITLASS